MKNRLVVKPSEKNLAVFSYKGLGFAVRIGDNDIDTIFDVAKSAIKKQIEKEGEATHDRQEEGEKVRTKRARKARKASEPVAGDTTAGGVPS